MNKSQSIVIAVLVICIINDSINGFSVGRKERHGYLSNRIQSNGFNMKAAMKNLSNGYKYVTKYFSKDARTFPSTTSDISDCTDCFLGMQVSAREAYVVSTLLLVNSIIKNTYILDF